MSESSLFSDRLDSWKEIAVYINRSVRTVIRWEEERGLPVHRIPGGQRQNVYAFRREIDAWMQSGSAGDADGAGLTAVAAPGLSLPSLTGLPGLPETHAVAGIGGPRMFPAIARRTLLWGAIGLACATFSIYAAVSAAVPKKMYLFSETQITWDHASKNGLVTDGSNLYFGEFRGGRILLFRTSVDNGEIAEIPTPFVEVEPVAVSGDGQKLLVLTGVGEETERPLWIVSVHEASARQVGRLLCHSASWSPGERQIAFASGTGLYLTADDGRTQRLLYKFAEIPEDIRWSLDGRSLIFRLEDPDDQESAVWKIAIDAGEAGRMTALVPLISKPRHYTALSPVLDKDGRALLTEDSELLLLDPSRWPFTSGFTDRPLLHEPFGISNLAVDAKRQRLYFVKQTAPENELVRFDETVHEFRPFLAGNSARDVDFARDGRHIAYVRTDETLWVAGPDGETPRQLNTTGLILVALPRWSPDGRWIAFMGRAEGRPFRIYLVDSAGGVPQEASDGVDNQGAPTWSPDGRRLLYGRVMCQEDRSCAILTIDRESGQETMVPGSEGLSTARWSPDGRYIAALAADKFQVLLLDRQTGKWRKLADGISGNDLAWGPDSKSVYASRPSGDRPGIVRISIADGKLAPAIDLTEFSKSDGRVDTWFAVAPDASIVFLRTIADENIYALQYAIR